MFHFLGDASFTVLAVSLIFTPSQPMLFNSDTADGKVSLWEVSPKQSYTAGEGSRARVCATNSQLYNLIVVERRPASPKMLMVRGDAFSLMPPALVGYF
ncbi:MAG: hypothetical protein AAF335_03910 [Bacteroidota bacterium]